LKRIDEKKPMIYIGFYHLLAEAVSESAWISENSLYVYGANLVDNGFGCDFRFVVKGRQYRVEVKATQGDADVFSMGSLEIALAVEIAGKTKRRKATFLIVHGKNALSPLPLAPCHRPAEPIRPRQRGSVSDGGDRSTCPVSLWFRRSLDTCLSCVGGSRLCAAAWGTAAMDRQGRADRNGEPSDALGDQQRGTRVLKNYTGLAPCEFESLLQARRHRQFDPRAIGESI
jgi:hypothetical protein